MKWVSRYSALIPTENRSEAGSLVLLRPSEGDLPAGLVSLRLRLIGPHTPVRVLVTSKKSSDEEFRYATNLGNFKKGKLDATIKLMGTPIRLELELAQAVKLVSAQIAPLDYWSVLRNLAIPHAAHLLLAPSRALSFKKSLQRHLKDSGWRGLNPAIRHEFIGGSDHFKNQFSLWRENYAMPSEKTRGAIASRTRQLKGQPLISILLPVYNTDERWLRSAIESVRRQIYPNWQLCLADDASTKSYIRPLLEEYQSLDPRIRVAFRENNGHISAASNSALELATGEWVALLDHDDELTEDSLYWVAEEFNRHPAAQLIYSDEDKLDEFGRHIAPFFKPDWNPDLMLSLNLVTHLAVFRRSVLSEVGGFRLGFEGAQDYDLVLRVSEKISPAQIRHIPRILYHWRAITGSTALGADAKDYAFDASRRAILDHLSHRKIRAEVEDGYGSWHRVRYALPQPPPWVSLIVCTRDKRELLQGIVEDILHRTAYQPFELWVVDNQSREAETLEYLRTIQKDPRVHLLSYDLPFNFSAMNNLAAKKAKGEILVFLNNDLRTINPDWLEEMVRFAAQPEIGAVGAKLYYPDDSVQHAGIILGIGGIAGHAHKGLPRLEPGYVGRAMVIQGVTAVTGACLATRRELFLALHGFDEQNLPIAYNDVDYCLKVRETGARVVFTPYAELYHLESASRGSDESPANRERFARDRAYMKSRWGNWLAWDPSYNPNLTLETEDLSLAFPPRIELP